MFYGHIGHCYGPVLPPSLFLACFRHRSPPVLSPSIVLCQVGHWRRAGAVLSSSLRVAQLRGQGIDGPMGHISPTVPPDVLSQQLGCVWQSA